MFLKKILAVFISLCLIMGCIVFVNAETDLIVTLESIETGSNEEFEVNLLLENNPGIAGLTLVFEFDNSVITPISFENKSGFTALTTIDSNDVDLSSVNLIKVTYDSMNNINSNGVIGTFKFKAENNIETTSTVISWLSDIPEASVWNSDLEDITYTLVNGTVSFSDVTTTTTTETTTESTTTTITEATTETTTATTTVAETTTKATTEATTKTTEAATETTTKVPVTQATTEKATEATTKSPVTQITTEKAAETTTKAIVDENTTETTTVRQSSSGSGSSGGGAGASSINVSGYTAKATTTEATTETTTKSVKSEQRTETTTENTVSVNNVMVTIGSKTVIIGDESYDIDVAPYIQAASNSTLVPLRFVALAIANGNIDGADNSENILWDNVTKTATIIFGNKIIEFTAGSDTMIVDGKSQIMENGVKAEIVDSRMFIPFRALGNALGVDVEWDSDTKTAVYKNK